MKPFVYIWGINCCNYKYYILYRQVVPETMASDHRPVFVDIGLK
jgi:hypothetical protein